MAWQKCPVCEGCGQKAAAFYPDLYQSAGGNSYTVPQPFYVNCRSCGGRGIIEIKEEGKGSITILPEPWPPKTLSG